ncbi:hypothetical protein [Paracoccus xiamenensis]|uniref:hypothetical protein n=1 Tax=Paracoccus xiamenensis TaxID=2714901 RepID=UPI001F434C16|nr:hypothetical protein [Paracoccus xiamenensis]
MRRGRRASIKRAGAFPALVGGVARSAASADFCLAIAELIFWFWFWVFSTQELHLGLRLLLAIWVITNTSDDPAFLDLLEIDDFDHINISGKLWRKPSILPRTSAFSV